MDNRLPRAKERLMNCEYFINYFKQDEIFFHDEIVMFEKKKEELCKVICKIEHGYCEAKDYATIESI